MKKSIKKIIIAKIDNLEEIISFVMDYSEKFSISQRIQFHIQLAVEEIFVNVCKYAYQETLTGDVEIICTPAPSGFSISIEDNGVSFNPLERDDPDTEADMDDRDIGGLGIFLTKTFIKEMSYKRIGTRNVTTLFIDEEE
ncbi:ATP-binding protein [bacterium]|nr:ATP-binding protein [bacterium]